MTGIVREIEKVWAHVQVCWFTDHVPVTGQELTVDWPHACYRPGGPGAHRGLTTCLSQARWPRSSLWTDHVPVTGQAGARSSPWADHVGCPGMSPWGVSCCWLRLGVQTDCIADPVNVGCVLPAHPLILSLRVVCGDPKSRIRKLSLLPTAVCY